jgi:hypothetical protein
MILVLGIWCKTGTDWRDTVRLLVKLDCFSYTKAGFVERSILGGREVTLYTTTVINVNEE